MDSDVFFRARANAILLLMQKWFDVDRNGQLLHELLSTALIALLEERDIATAINENAILDEALSLHPQLASIHGLELPILIDMAYAAKRFGESPFEIPNLH